MSDQDGDLPEVNDGPPAENEPLSACPIDPEERLDTERVLGLFAPRTPRLKRERLLALVASVRREVEPRSKMAVRFRTPWYWPAATAAMTATSLSLAVLLGVRVNAEPPVRVEFQERIVYQPVYLPSAPLVETAKDEAVVTVPQPSETVVLNRAPPDDYLTSRSLVLAQGVESLEFRRPLAQGSTPNSPATRDELLRQLGPTKSTQSGMTRSLQTGMTNKSWIWPSW
ncbi:MAG: hypothetical protein IAF94_13640 [Pirellulaceae bacterium]|nr:hypothetical protein [Pirellulaceae bacterium]